MRTATLALALAFTACHQPIAPIAEPPLEEPQPEPRPEPQPQPEPEACASVPVPTVCDPLGPCWLNPHPIATSPLTSVWAHGCAAWAVGREGLVLRRTAEGWKPQPPFTSQYLFGVSGTAEDDVWAVGTSASIFHFDGTAWTELSSSWGGETYQGVWAAARGVIYLAGSEGLHRFELAGGRSTFTTLLAPPGAHFNAVTGDGATLRAVGAEQTMEGWRTVTWSYDGARWTREASLAETSFSSLVSVDGAFYAAGQRRINDDPWAFLTRLTPELAPMSATERAVSFSGVAGRSATELLVVGTGYPDSALRFDGQTFHAIDGAPRADLTGISQGGRDYFVIGSKLGRISRGAWLDESEGPHETLGGVLPLEDGEVWLSNGAHASAASGGEFVQTFTEPNRFLRAVGGKKSTDLWGADAYGGLWHYDGNAWFRESSPTGVFTHFAMSRDGVWGWGWGDHELWRLQRQTWQSVALPVSGVVILDVMYGRDEALIVSAATPDGSAHYEWRFDGAQFVDVTAPQRLRLLAGLSATDTFGIGEDSLFHFDGQSWSRVSELPQLNAMDAVMNDDRMLVIATSNGRLTYWGGSRFFERSVGAPVALFGLAVDADGRAVWAAGEGGAVVKMPW